MNFIQKMNETLQRNARKTSVFLFELSDKKCYNGDRIT